MTGATAIKQLMARMGFTLNDEQAALLWTECAEQLQTASGKKIIASVQKNTTHSLDTLEREVLMDCIGRLLTGMVWPNNGDAASVSEEFYSKLAASFKVRGYTRKDV